MAIQTSRDGLNHKFRLVGAPDWDGDNTCLFSRVVVAPGEQGVTYEYHLCQ